MNMSANKGDGGDPIATPIYLDVNLSIKREINILGTDPSSSFTFFLVNDVFNSWLVYIFLRIMSIMVSNGTLVNSDLTSNDTIWNPSGTFICLINYLHEMSCTFNGVFRSPQR